MCVMRVDNGRKQSYFIQTNRPDWWWFVALIDQLGAGYSGNYPHVFMSSLCPLHA